MEWAAAILVAVAAPADVPERLRPLLDNTSWVSPRSIDDCDALRRLLPGKLAAYGCYSRLAWATLDRRPALRRMQQLLARRPADPRAQLTLGILVDDKGGDSERLFRAAAEGFHREGDLLAEARARIYLQAVLCDAGRCSEADEQMALAQRIVETSRDPELLQHLLYFQGLRAFHDGDLGKAALLLTQAREKVFPHGIWWFKHRVLDALGGVYSATGRHREALEAYQAEVELLRAEPFFQALARHGVATEAVRLAAAGEIAGEEANRLLAEALAAEVRVGARHYQGEGEFNTRVLLGLQLGATEEGIAQIERALAIGYEDGHPELQIVGARILAKLLAERDPAHPQRPLRLAAESIERARLTGRRPDVARGLLARAWVRWRSGDRPAAVRDALDALDAFDELRARQPEEMVRARSSAESGAAYALVSGWLLDHSHGPAADGDLALSFSTMERLRARVLLEALGAARTQAPGPLRDERASLSAQRARVQRRLLEPIEQPERDVLLASLASLERSDDELRDRIARAHAPLSSRREPPPQLAEVQAALGEDEAMLAFQVWSRQGGAELPYQDGSSWAVLITRGAATAFRIPDGEFLARSAHVFAALIERRDGAEAEGAARLHRELLAAPLSALPAHVRRLVIVPDGPLHYLPFDALRERPSAPPLADRLRIELSPSAALWLRWRRARQRPALFPLLALADPQPTVGALSSLGLRPLPWGRSEAESAVRLLGRGSRLEVGAEASERLLKEIDLTSFGVLHLAAHAVVDDERPERSAILLSPGAADEDGLLQTREVAALRLEGRAVVLAACRTATGEVLRGEGALSLARAFFEAGAHAVVGSLWPLRDDEAAAFFAAFYRGLAAGAPVGEAMVEARRERIRAGAPAAAWAGLSMLGNGELQPVPPPGRAFGAWAAAVIAAASASVLLLRRRRARR